jgi:lipoprotein-releasing system ATP-binding protein
VADRLLLVDQVTKIYGTDAPTVAVDSVGFQMARGEFASLIGQSGSGKSTLLNIVGLLDSPTEGDVVLEKMHTGILDKHLRAALRNDLLGFVFQFHYLLPEFSVIENVLMPVRIRKKRDDGAEKRAEEILGLLGLAGLEGKNANQLSGGQKQRVAIGRALINRPALILADEPTGNLDTKNSNQVFELFRQINRDQGTAFLIVTHDRRIAQQTDRILEVEDGRLIQDVKNSYLKTPDS